MARVTVAQLRTDFEHCREVWEEHGCFVVDDAIAPELLQRAEDAAWRVWGRVKNGGEPVEGVAPGASSIGALLSPEFDEPAFGEHLSSPDIARYAEHFLGERLRLGFAMLWCAEEGQGYHTTWHRGALPRSSL